VLEKLFWARLKGRSGHKGTCYGQLFGGTITTIEGLALHFSLYMIHVLKVAIDAYHVLGEF
jgi:hypothetical protein